MLLKPNINKRGRLLRAMIGIGVLLAALYCRSLLLALAGLFTLYEALSSWCVVNQLLGRNSCPLPNGT